MFTEWQQQTFGQVQILFQKVVTNDFANLYDIVKTTYKAVDSFPTNFTLKFEDKEFGFIDFESPFQLTDRTSNILMVSKPESELSNIVLELNKNHISPNLDSSPTTSV